MNYIIPIEDFLFESKRTAKENFLDRGLISEEDFNLFLDVDTTPTKKFIDSMCMYYSQGSSKEEVIETFQKAIPMFTRNIVKVDIKSVKTLDELKSLVDEKQDYKTRSEIREEARDGATVVYEDDTQKVYLIETKEASIIYGKGTKWCTSIEDVSATGLKNQFNQYYHSLKVSLYYILSKVRPQSDPLYKVAIVVPPNEKRNVESTWNSKDKKIDFKKTLNILDLDESIFKYVRERRERVYEIEEFIKGSWVLNEKGEVDVDGDVDLSHQFLDKIPFKFGRVSGDFDLSGNFNLFSLNGCPTFVGGNFDCRGTIITSLEYSPTQVGGNFNCEFIKTFKSLKFSPTYVGGIFNCMGNRLTSLEGCPVEVGDFLCAINNLTSLRYCPTIVKSNFNCKYNQLTSLEFSPEMIFGDFICLNNRLETLEFAPKIINGEFNCWDNSISSLEGCPIEVGGDFNIGFNKLSYEDRNSIKYRCKVGGKIYNG